jgi:hypothetical protein
MAMAVCGMHRELRLRLGFDEPAVIRLRAALADNAVTPDILDDAALDRLLIVGPPTQCLTRIRRLEDEGAGQLSARMPAVVADTVDFQGNLQALAKDVLPHLHAQREPVTP